MKTPVLILLFSIIAAGAIIVLNKPTPPAKRTRLGNKVASTPAKSNLPVTTIEWKDTILNMGKINDGALLEVLYNFKNTGSEPLVFIDIKASCGCTIPEKPEKPVLPGDTGTIKAIFDSKGRLGTNHKVLTAYINTKEAIQQLVFDVEVVDEIK